MRRGTLSILLLCAACSDEPEALVDAGRQPAGDATANRDASASDGAPVGDAGDPTDAAGSDATLPDGGSSFPLCTQGRVGLEGTLSSSSAQYSTDRRRAFSSSTTFALFFGDDGFAYVTGPALLGPTQSVEVVAQLPLDATPPGEVACGLGAEHTRTGTGANTQDRIALPQLIDLGRCDALTAFTDTATLCMSALSSCPGGRRSLLRGTLDGQSVEEINLTSHVQTTANVGFRVLFTPGRGMLLLSLREATPRGTLVLRKPDPAAPLVVYCVRRAVIEGSLPEVTVRLEEVGRLGDSCAAPPSAGSLNICAE